MTTDQNSQFVPYSGLHVVGKMNICFETIILRGIKFIVNKCPIVWGLKLWWGKKYIDFSFILILFILVLFVLILFIDQGKMENDGLWAQELKKNLQVKQWNFQNMHYLPEVGIPILSSKKSWPRCWQEVLRKISFAAPTMMHKVKVGAQGRRWRVRWIGHVL